MRLRVLGADHSAAAHAWAITRASTGSVVVDLSGINHLPINLDMPLAIPDLLRLGNHYAAETKTLRNIQCTNIFKKHQHQSKNYHPLNLTNHNKQIICSNETKTLFSPDHSNKHPPTCSTRHQYRCARSATHWCACPLQSLRPSHPMGPMLPQEFMAKVDFKQTVQFKQSLNWSIGYLQGS